MKKCLFILFVSIISISLATISIAEANEESMSGQQKSSWYIGFGLGSGQGWIEGDSFNKLFDEFGDQLGTSPDTSPRVTLNFGVGGIINPYLHLGLDISAIRQSATYELYGQEGDISFQINNYFAALTYYPFATGLFLKGGAGLSTFILEVTGDIEPNGTDTYSGYGFLIGTGYDFWLGKTFNLGLHVDYSRQTYSDSEAPDDTEFLSVYVSFYWL